jgi:hypothetical protein
MATHAMLGRVRTLEERLDRAMIMRSRTASRSVCPPGLEQLAASLDGRVFIEFFGERGAISALRIDEQGTRYHPSVISNEETLDILDRLHLLIFKSSRSPESDLAREPLIGGAMDGLLERLGASLQPVIAGSRIDDAQSDNASGSHLVIAPHGPLHYLPLHAALIDDSPICQSTLVEYTPSATVWLHRRATSDGKAIMSVLTPRSSVEICGLAIAAEL